MKLIKNFISKVVKQHYSQFKLQALYFFK